MSLAPDDPQLQNLVSTLAAAVGGGLITLLASIVVERRREKQTESQLFTDVFLYLIIFTFIAEVPLESIFSPFGDILKLILLAILAFPLLKRLQLALPILIDRINSR